MDSNILFQVIFDENPDGFFKSGEIISGKVQMTTLNEKLVRAITIHCVGIKEIYYVGESNYESTRNKEPHLYSYEKFLKLEAGQHDFQDGNPFVLPVGEYEFPFRCLLPLDMPSTIKGDYGYIKYNITAKLVKGASEISLSNNTKYEHPVTIFRSVDLNQFPQAKYPIHKEDHNELCCCCCACGPIIFTLDALKTAYMSGESIDLNILMINGSCRNINKLRIKFLQHLKFKLHQNIAEGNQEEKKILKEFEYPNIVAHKKIEHKISIPITALAPTSPPTDIIAVQYSIHVDIWNPFFHCDLFFDNEIIIGTVPLREGEVAQTGSVVIEQPSSFGWRSDMLRSDTGALEPLMLNRIIGPSAPPIGIDDEPPSYATIFNK